MLPHQLAGILRPSLQRRPHRRVILLPQGAGDDAVRAAYESWGYGPRYQLPGTSHRTGHGIGMEGHEPVNLVHGEMTPLAVGMCFSNEPGIYIPGEIGMRSEVNVYLVPGQAVVTRRGEWVQYSTPGAEGAEYVAVCLPAFSPDSVHRDEP